MQILRLVINADMQSHSSPAAYVLVAGEVVNDVAAYEAPPTGRIEGVNFAGFADWVIQFGTKMTQRDAERVFGELPNYRR